LSSIPANFSFNNLFTETDVTPFAFSSISAVTFITLRQFFLLITDMPLAFSSKETTSVIGTKLPSLFAIFTSFMEFIFCLSSSGNITLISISSSVLFIFVATDPSKHDRIVVAMDRQHLFIQFLFGRL